MGFYEWFHIVAVVAGFLSGGHGLYAWFKLRDKPTAIQATGMTLMFFSFTAAKWFMLAIGWAGLVIGCYGLVLTIRRQREAEEALARSRRPAFPTT